jgi:putative transport protein
MSFAPTEPLLVLFIIMALGWWLGQIRVRGITLGSAGVLFVALAFGNFGYSTPKEITDLGLLLFVYAVGLQAGRRFFRTFQREGMHYVIIGAVTVLAGGLATVLVARAMNLSFDLATGLFTGALTNTPALAAASAAVERINPGGSADVSAGYGIAYPFSMIGVVLFVQVFPRLLHRDIKGEEDAWRRQRQQEAPSLVVKKYVLTNPNCSGKRVSELNPSRMSQANISRVRSGDQVFAATKDVVLHEGDIVMVVGPEAEQAKMRLLLGEETDARMDINTNVTSLDIEVTEPSLSGKTLAQMRVWEQYGVVITRLRREGLEIVPTGAISLDAGDSIRVVGERDAVEAFATLVHGDGQRADETNMVPFLTGLVLGIILGSININLGNGIDLKLGTAGGAFIVSLLVGHFGRIGPFRMYVPTAAKNVLRELGLALFLAGVGTLAGSRIVPIIQQHGWSLVLAGAIITCVAVLAGVLMTTLLYRMSTLASLGSLCAAMTNPPGLAAANAGSTTGIPALAYASVYPVALIFKIVLAQILVSVLRLLQ